jgi:hypothetical protein
MLCSVIEATLMAVLQNYVLEYPPARLVFISAHVLLYQLRVCIMHLHHRHHLGGLWVSLSEQALGYEGK